MGQTVNLLAYAFGGSNPSLPTLLTQRQPVVASVLFCTWPVYFVQSVANSGREVGEVRRSVFLIYNERADQGAEQVSPDETFSFHRGCFLWCGVGCCA